MNKKLSRKEFLELQQKWYEKLKKKGFQDIEWYSNRTGLGQGSPYLKSKDIPDSGAIRGKFNFETRSHFTICRKFLTNGPFYAVFRDKYRNSNDLQRTFKTFKAYFASQPLKFNKAQEECFRLYCSGLSIRKISTQLRCLYKKKRLPKLSIARKGCLPYSIFWVKTHLDKMKQACSAWSANQDYEEPTPNPYLMDAEQSCLAAEAYQDEEDGEYHE